MAINYFLGRSVAWLQAELAKAQNDLAAGKTLVGVNSGDVSSTERAEMSPHARISMLLAALSAADPENYPPEDCMPTDRTKVYFP